MKRTLQALAAVLIGGGLLALGPAPAVCGDEFCPMGGTQIKVDVVKDKAIDWGKDRRKAGIENENSDAWSVLTLSKTDDDIAILVTEGSVFFGVAGRAGRDVDARDAEKAFGSDLRKLREAIKKEMGELWKAGVVKISGSDVQPLSEAAGLGVLEKERDWELKTKDCKGTEVDTSALR